MTEMTPAADHPGWAHLAGDVFMDNSIKMPPPVPFKLVGDTSIAPGDVIVFGAHGGAMYGHVAVIEPGHDTRTRQRTIDHLRAARAKLRYLRTLLGVAAEVNVDLSNSLLRLQKLAVDKGHQHGDNPYTISPAEIWAAIEGRPLTADDLPSA